MEPSADERALWAAIRAAPDDDLPRLVYADWLEEHGRGERAELIRVQIALAVLGPDRRKGRKQRVPLEAREAALLAAHAGEWLAPVRAVLAGSSRFSVDADWLPAVTLRRGFASYPHVGLESGRRVAAAGDSLEPLDALDVLAAGVEHSHEAVATIAAWPGAGCVRCLSTAWATDADVSAVVRAPHLTNVRSLGVWSGPVTDDSAAALAAWPGAGRLTHLDVQDTRITDAGAGALADSPHLGALRRLAVNGTAVTAAGAARLRGRFGDAVSWSPA